jgi:hypothetical protein
MAKTVMELAEMDTRLKQVARNEYAGPCPGCHGEDRFVVNLSKREGGGWLCRYCWVPGEDRAWSQEGLGRRYRLPAPLQRHELSGSQS